MSKSDYKLDRAISVLLIANKYKHDPPKLAEFISKNESYFKVSNTLLDQMKIGTPKKYVDDIYHNEKVPVFEKL